MVRGLPATEWLRRKASDRVVNPLCPLSPADFPDSRVRCAEDSARYSSRCPKLCLSLVKESFAGHGSQKQIKMQITPSAVLASILLLFLLAPFCVAAPEKPHVTSEQVTHAVQEVEKLAQKQIDQNAVPGLAIAVVFQDKVVYA